jgi:photosystem II stability/assembly factor-like uncharacterized protein
LLVIYQQCYLNENSIKMKITLTFIILISFFSNSFAQWNFYSTGVSQVQTSISAVDDNIAWVCGHLGVVCRTTNGGTSWTSSVVTPDSATLINIFAVDANTALVSAREFSPSVASVWKTTNGGGTWAQVFTQNSGEINGIKIFNGGSGFMVGDPVGGRWSLWRTTNSGTSWDSTGLYLQGTGLNGIENGFYTNGNNFWFGTGNGRIYHSSNSGSNWSFQSLGSQGIVSTWLNGTTGLTTTFGGVYRTTNNGANWTSIPAPGSGNQLAVTGAGSKFWMVTRGSVNIYTTTNNGDNWSSTFTQETKTDITISRTGSKIWIATVSDRVLYASASSYISTISSEIPGSFSLSQNYPNPFNPVTHFQFAVAEFGFVTLKVYDIMGKEIETIVSENLQPGIYKAKFNAVDLPSGVYFYTLSSASFTETKKMLLLK